MYIMYSWIGANLHIFGFLQFEIEKNKIETNEVVPVWILSYDLSFWKNLKLALRVFNSERKKIIESVFFFDYWI